MQLMDKSGFLKKYRSEHSEIWIYLVFELIFDIAGTIIIILNTKGLIESHSRHDEPKLVFLVFLGIFFWIMGLVFLCLIKNAEAKGNKEYENYLRDQATIATNPNSQAISQAANDEWVCKNCGKVNKNYVGSCGCGEVKPK